MLNRFQKFHHVLHGKLNVKKSSPNECVMFRRGGASGKICICLITLLIAIAVSACIVIVVILTKTKGTTTTTTTISKKMYALF
jgi:hypothetical protein